jgi:hypothetical protein
MSGFYGCVGKLRVFAVNIQNGRTPAGLKDIQMANVRPRLTPE